MKFVDFQSGGAPETMQIRETQRPEITASQVLVKVVAFGINRADVLQREGKYPPPIGESEILGLEMSGEVVCVGENVTKWKTGDRVFGLVAGGGYAEFVAVNSSHLMAVPDNLSFEECAGLAEVFLTAYQTVTLSARLKPNSRILIHAGASAVGLAMIQLAKLQESYIVVTSSSDEKLKKCCELGANLGINYLEKDFVEVAKSASLSFDLIVDFVGGNYLNRNLKLLEIDGTIVFLAMLAGRYADNLDLALLLAKRAKIIGSTLRNRSDNYKAKLIDAFWTSHFSDFQTGKLHVNIDSVIPASQISKAHVKLQNNTTCGKVICVW